MSIVPAVKEMKKKKIIIWEKSNEIPYKYLVLIARLNISNMLLWQELCQKVRQITRSSTTLPYLGLDIIFFFFFLFQVRKPIISRTQSIPKIFLRLKMCSCNRIDHFKSLLTQGGLFVTRVQQPLYFCLTGTETTEKHRLYHQKYCRK